MIEVFTIVSITAGGMEQEMITPDNHGNMAIDRNKRFRAFPTLRGARSYRTRLRKNNRPLKQGGADFHIARLRVNEDMTLESEWVE